MADRCFSRILDVYKRQVFDRVKIYHDSTSMDRALGFLQYAEQQFAAKPVIVIDVYKRQVYILYQKIKKQYY